MNPGKIYHGVVLFIVHPPIEDRTLSRNVEWARSAIELRKRITTALNSAGLRRIPVAYLPGISNDKKTMDGILPGVKNKPVIIEIEHSGFGREFRKKIKEELNKANVVPSRAICLGEFRELCVTQTAAALRTIYPRAAVHIIEGSSTLLIGGDNKDRAKKRRLAYKETIQKLKIQTSKKLTFRHYIP